MNLNKNVPLRENVPIYRGASRGSRIARRDASGNVYYYFPDSLGSEVSITNATGTPCFDADFYLFGGEKVFTSNCPPSYKFAGMERDAETGLDHTLFRQYSSQFGRWMTPDPMGGDVTNPQSLNRYAYVLNNPTSLTDPLGLDAGDPMNCSYDKNGVIHCEPTHGGDNGGSCSDSHYAYMHYDECNGRPGCSFFGDPNCGYGGCQNITNDNVQFCDMWTQSQYPPLGQWNPLPSVTQPTAANQLGALAPQAQREHCAGVALKKNAVALSFDATGIGAGFVPGGDAAVAIAQSTVSFGSGIYSGFHHDTTGEALSLTAYGTSILTPIAKAMGGDIAKAVPGLGTFISVVSFAHDVQNLYEDYGSCMAGVQ